MVMVGSVAPGGSRRCPRVPQTCVRWAPARRWRRRQWVLAGPSGLH